VFVCCVFLFLLLLFCPELLLLGEQASDMQVSDMSINLMPQVRSIKDLAGLMFFGA